jgi:ketosteroid isomerase-like protein
MSQEDLETVKRAVAAVNARDIDRYLDCCTEDIELHFVAMAAVGGVYIGRDAIQRFWTDIADTAPDFRLEIERLEQIAADQVLASMRVSATGRASGLSIADESPGTNVYDFAGGKIRRVRIFRDRREALEAVGLSEQDAHADS